MSWQKNRRRKRVWYQHYSQLAREIRELTASGRPIAGEAILKLFHDLYERRRLHKRQRIANSAYDSMLLAAEDAGLMNLSLAPATYDRASVRSSLVGALPKPEVKPAPKGVSPLDAILDTYTVVVEGINLDRQFMGIDLAKGRDLSSSPVDVVSYPAPDTVAAITEQIRTRIKEITSTYIGMDAKEVQAIIAEQLKKPEPEPPF